MVASDTIVGIVGSVLLVVVMAGVFVYEYNNQPDDGDDNGGGGSGANASAIRHFSEDNPTLDAEGDMDGDGKPNYSDDDLDGDGTPNAEDMDLSVTATASGSIGPQVLTAVVPSFDLGFTVENGTMHIDATIDAAGVAGVLPTNLVVQLLDPDGTVIADTASSPLGSTTLTLEVSAESQELPAGEYSIHIEQNMAGPGASFDVTSVVHYGGAADHAH